MHKYEELFLDVIENRKLEQKEKKEDLQKIVTKSNFQVHEIQSIIENHVKLMHDINSVPINIAEIFLNTRALICELTAQYEALLNG